MTTTGIRQLTIAALDMPAETVAAEAACLVLRQAARETNSPSDQLAYANDQYLITHPKVCLRDEDYPGWADHVARLEAQNALHRQVARWNAAHPIGTPVSAYPGARPEDDRNDERLDTATRSKAQVLGGHTAVVWVDGHSACIALSHIDIRTGGAS
ncbi:hypothetical protein [Streptomyces sp. NPDC058268]|uniref:hypothetical protein n=1 Tax=Streptomyces sp. NPDC058268 TaxID=3346413 RepID=UPI0036E3AC24